MHVVVQVRLTEGWYGDESVKITRPLAMPLKNAVEGKGEYLILIREGHEGSW